MAKRHSVRHAHAKVASQIAAEMHAHGLSLRQIAQQLGVSRMAVARAIAYANSEAVLKKSANAG